MFQSEQLQEKWAPLLDYEGLDPIKDNHRKPKNSKEHCRTSTKTRYNYIES